MMKRESLLLHAVFYLFFAISIFTISTFTISTASAQYSLSGKVQTKEDSRPLSDAVILLNGAEKGALSNLQGEYQLKNIPAGKYEVRVSFVGFKPATSTIELNGDVVLDFALETDGNLDNIVVYAQKEMPITTTEITKEELQKVNLAQDLPILLNYTPSVVTTSDAGAGVGYTSMSIRGTDPYRINVTLNGLPVNDPESHGTWFVNTPDLSSSISNITIQRGVGTSSNGAAAFGASVNVNTNIHSEKAFVETNNSIGSFHTQKNNVIFGTGRIKDKFSVAGRLSRINSNGYIDRASADLRSFFLSGNYQGKLGNVTFNIMQGAQVTYQAWDGIPQVKVNGDAAGIEKYIAENYLSDKEADNLRNSGNRTFNKYTYNNEVDNYKQNYYQLLYQKDINTNFSVNAALFYTKGYGYFEQYKPDAKLADNGLTNVVIGQETIKRSDLIRRRWLDNDFYGGIWSFNYKSSAKLGGISVLDVVLGGGMNQYHGRHFGEVIWARFASNSEIRQRYYDSYAFKTDFNSYLKATYQPIENLFAFADMQVRTIDYSMVGVGNKGNDITQQHYFTFYNPKVGAKYIKNNNELYVSYGVANKEPTRADFQASTPNRPTSERLDNVEIGYQFVGKTLRGGINYYRMEYRNQLVTTGQLDDVGNDIRVNANSYRQGIELTASYRYKQSLFWDGNITFSENKIYNFTEAVQDWNTSEYIFIAHKNTDIRLSPTLIAGNRVTVLPFKKSEIAFMVKYVSKQYLDNTSNADRSIPAFFVGDVRLAYNVSSKTFEKVNLTLMVNNVFNTNYSPNGYTYGQWDGAAQQPIYYNHIFPQAGTNFLLGLQIRI